MGEEIATVDLELPIPRDELIMARTKRSFSILRVVVMICVLFPMAFGGMWYWGAFSPIDPAVAGPRNPLWEAAHRDGNVGFAPALAVAPQPPITEVTVRPAGDPKQPRPEELVLGVAIDGQARAYSINTLTGPRREIINDRLADTPIAATW